MSRSARQGERRRAAVVVTAIFALLFQGAFAIACDVHDLGHAGSSVVDGGHAEDSDDNPASDSTDAGQRDAEGRWHDLFATCHGCLQVVQAAVPVFLDPMHLPAAGLPPFVHDDVPPAPGALLLRPPILV